MIRWFAINSIASNLIMGLIIAIGLWCYSEKVQPEVQPTAQFDQVRIDVNYRGGSPEDVERAVVIAIERAVENLPGIETIESHARVGRGNVVLRTTKGTKPEDLLEDVKPLVDAISTFPQETEPPRFEIPDSSKWFDVIKIVIYGEMDEKDLLAAARRIRDDLTGLPGISQAAILGASPFEVGIEASSSTPSARCNAAIRAFTKRRGRQKPVLAANASRVRTSGRNDCVSSSSQRERSMYCWNR